MANVDLILLPTAQQAEHEFGDYYNTCSDCLQSALNSPIEFFNLLATSLIMILLFFEDKFLHSVFILICFACRRTY